jgi:transketolase
MIIAHTIPGKAVSFMEHRFEWHGKPPSKDDTDAALEELESGKKIIEEEE